MGVSTLPHVVLSPSHDLLHIHTFLWLFSYLVYCLSPPLTSVIATRWGVYRSYPLSVLGMKALSIWNDCLVSNMGDALAADTHQGGEHGRRRRRALELGLGLVKSMQNVQVGSWRVRSTLKTKTLACRQRFERPHHTVLR